MTQVALEYQETTVEQTTVDLLPAADVLDTLANSSKVNAVILDPWYNKGVGGKRDDYDDWLTKVIQLSCEISDHVFIWGFPEILANQISRLPKNFHLLAWLTWFYKNCPSVIRGWRSAQNTCLHLASEGATVYPEHF